MIRIECPNCKAELEGEDNLAGQKVKCPTCNEDFIAHDKQKLERERREFYEKTLAQKTQPQRPRSLSKKFILSQFQKDWLFPVNNLFSRVPSPS